MVVLLWNLTGQKTNVYLDSGMVQIVRLRLTQGVALLASLLSICLIALCFDIETMLKQIVPGNPMPDAFKGLNGAIPIFTAFIAGTLLLVISIVRKRLYSLLLPLLFGPSACFTGYLVTENWNDPNWFDLFAITTIGMLVSCAVTFILLAIESRKTTEPNIAAKPSVDRVDLR